MKIAKLFTSHLVAPRTVQHLNQLATQTDNVWVIHDCTSNPEFEKRKFANVINYTNNDHKKIGYLSPTKAMVDSFANKALRTLPSIDIYFNPEYAVIQFAKEHPEFDYIWRIEYDVYFNGHWQYFFDITNESDADFLGLYVATKNEWTINSKVWGTLNFDVPEEHEFGAFFPVQRYSRKLIEVLDKEYSSGKYGYCEAAVPTLAYINGLKLQDLNELDNFYLPQTMRSVPHPIWTPEYFRNTQFMLYHPVR